MTCSHKWKIIGATHEHGGGSDIRQCRVCGAIDDGWGITNPDGSVEDIGPGEPITPESTIKFKNGFMKLSEQMYGEQRVKYVEVFIDPPIGGKIGPLDTEKGEE